ncbi:hypothetical protein [Lysinibacillus sphaericus]|nr:hypothetical protein [Lysinibacillus sphaericus]AMO35310.1 hypothetical protein AR327_22735 [Lysinibacillus sphaericus]AMR93087.1 hypothetical protein A1T07_23050 [Lysinibacillus sphaericus]MDR0161381.1 hypothetical protein [Lysinibacillus sphaericus]QPA52353.1 hypothetical protein INQ54_22920 [Lysinibacillus sphaericus]
MELYIQFEFESIKMIAKQTSFTKLERLYGFYFYDLTHPEDDEHFPDAIVKEGAAHFNYWGSIMTDRPIEQVEHLGQYYIADWALNLDDEEAPAPNEDFVNCTQFYTYDFYVSGVENEENIKFHRVDNLLDLIEPYEYSTQELTMDRTWNMPNKNTFEIHSIKDLLKEELTGGLIIDPFANNNSLAHMTNDLNTKYETDFHMDALEFLKLFADESVDVVLFDPPYSPRQVKEAYESIGLDTQGGRLTRASYWSNLKKEITRILRVGGKAISCGWNSGGMNNKDVFHINRIRLVAHGGNHNDTIATVSVKTKRIENIYVVEQAKVKNNQDYKQLSLW